MFHYDSSNQRSYLSSYIQLKSEQRLWYETRVALRILLGQGEGNKQACILVTEQTGKFLRSNIIIISDSDTVLGTEPMTKPNQRSCVTQNTETYMCGKILLCYK